MDLLGNRILTVTVDPNPLNTSHPVFVHPFFQSGRMMFFEEKLYNEFTKLHVFDMNSVIEYYDKKGELMCLSSEHESQFSFKSRSICVEELDFHSQDYVTIYQDKASISIYTYKPAKMGALKSKFSFWNGKDNPILSNEDEEESD